MEERVRDVPFEITDVVSSLLPRLTEVIEKSERRIMQEIRSLKYSPNLAPMANRESVAESVAPMANRASNAESVTLGIPKGDRSSNCSRLPMSATRSANSATSAWVSISPPESSRSGSLLGMFGMGPSKSMASLPDLARTIDVNVIYQGRKMKNAFPKRSSTDSTSDDRSSTSYPPDSSKTSVYSSMPTWDALPSMPSRGLGKATEPNSPLDEFKQSAKQKHSIAAPQLPTTHELDASQTPSESSNRSTRLGGLADMREHRQTELLTVAEMNVPETQTAASDSFWWRACGILPLEGDHLAIAWCSNLNRMFVLGLVVACATFSIHELVALLRNKKLEQACEAGLCLKDTIPPALALGCGSFCLICVLIWKEDHVVGSHEVVLEHYLTSIGAVERLIAPSRFAMAKSLFFWICSVGFCTYTSRDAQFTAVEKIMHIAVFALITNIFMAFVHNMVHTCLGLHLSIDNFCAKILQDGHVENAVHDWNIFQAVLRRVCINISRVYILLLTSAFAAMFLPLFFHDRMIAMIPGAFALLALLWVSVHVGETTSRCDRVPVFINTLDFGTNFDLQRAYLVDYISSSRAGFYMFEVRVTGEMVVKCAYIGLVLMAAVLTRMVPRS